MSDGLDTSDEQRLLCFNKGKVPYAQMGTKVTPRRPVHRDITGLVGSGGTCQRAGTSADGRLKRARRTHYVNYMFVPVDERLGH